MAMHQSQDINNAVLAVFEELEKLDLEILRCGIGIIDKENQVGDIWTTVKLHGRSSIQISGKEPMNIHPLLRGTYEAWLNQTDFFYELKGADLINYYRAVAGTNFTLPESQSLTDENHQVEQYYYTPTFKTGNLYAFKGSPFTDDAKSIMRRFASVLNLTFSRFLDLQKAEAQARQALIEAALERVRSRTLAMQKSEELAETAAVLFRQLISLGIEPNRLYIGICHEESTDIEFWVTDEDGSKVSTMFTADSNQNESMYKMHDAWKTQLKSIVIDMRGKELTDYFHYLGDTLHVPFKGGLAQKRRIQYISFFSSGFIGMASPDDQPQETITLLDRFAYVFNLTYARFNDLKMAELHAIQAEQDLIAIKAARKNAEDALAQLKATQNKLIQSEKMASLGELTAGIAHEIQNPLNFVNNFSEVSVELLDELKDEEENGHKEEVIAIADDLKQNLEKIRHHGKRADAIVKGMLQHSRSSSGQKEPTDLNALADEYLRLAYHGLRAKDKDFNAELITHFDEKLPKVNVVPQDIGRVLLNVINNAFYAVQQKAKTAGNGYKAEVKISTAQQNGSVIISVKDNGNGIPDAIKDKIMQPFFTTKPTGEGTGLGLSLSYDIVVKGHGGRIDVNTLEGDYTAFTVTLPLL
ncbi:MAG: GHKL domain-containing protein [Bacteroidetes bacterium]|nr:GHKL domain-containing protein [Bacteroidota bacterium]